MSTINKNLHPDDIDLSEFIKTLWRKKFHVLIIVLSFTVAFYTYGTNQTKFYQTKIKINQKKVYSFKAYQEFFIDEKKSINAFNTNFQAKLSSFDHLMAFVEQYKKINGFKSHIKKNNINIEDYFKGKFNHEYKKRNKFLLYTLDFSKPLPGQEFLNDYILYTNQIVGMDMAEIYSRNTQELILIYNEQIKLAKQLNYEFPQPGYNFEPQNFKNFFLKGFKVLNYELQKFEQMKDKYESFNQGFNPILEKASEPIQISKSALFFTLFGFTTGLFLAIFFVFLIDTVYRFKHKNTSQYSN
jgi:hypothetical protein